MHGFSGGVWTAHSCMKCPRCGIRHSTNLFALVCVQPSSPGRGDQQQDHGSTADSMAGPESLRPSRVQSAAPSSKNNTGAPASRMRPNSATAGGRVSAGGVRHHHHLDGRLQQPGSSGGSDISLNRGLGAAPQPGMAAGIADRDAGFDRTDTHALVAKALSMLGAPARSAPRDMYVIAPGHMPLYKGAKPAWDCKPERPYPLPGCPGTTGEPW